VNVLDTNAVSALLLPEPPSAVLSWMERNQLSDMHLTAVNEAELRYGIEIMAPGKRRRALEAALEGWLEDSFEGNILPFDSNAAKAYVQIAAKCRSLGRPISVADCMIAAICRAHSFTLITRNERHFRDAGIHTVNPWTIGLH